MNRIRFALLLGLLAPLSPAWAGAQEKVTLRWKFKAGEDLRYKQTQKNVTSFGGMAMEQEQSQTYSFAIQAVDDQGVATVILKVVALAVKSSGLQEMEWDSEKDKEAPADPQASMLSKMLGQTFMLKMNPGGKVVDVKGMDKVLEAMLKDQGPEAAVVGAQLKQMFNDDSYKSMMQQMTPQLPEQPVAKGDSWKNDFALKFPMMGSFKFDITSKLVDLKGDEAHIEQEIKLGLKADEGEKDNPFAGLVEIKNATGKAAGVFSVSRGLWLSQKTSMDMKMAAQGQEIPVKTEGLFRLVEGKKNF
jgi:hypothetical protein